MASTNPPDSTEDLQTLASIHDMVLILLIKLLKISQLLNIHSPPEHEKFLHSTPQTLVEIKLAIRKIYNKLLVNSTPIQNISSDNDKSKVFQEDLLQKQESKNRSLLRKQFEFKEFQNTLLDELNQEKTVNRKLNHHISQLRDEIQQKTLEIMHLQNQARAYQRGNRDFLNYQKSDILTGRSYNMSTLGYPYGNNNERSKDDKKMTTSRQKEYNKLNPKKINHLKEKALYALYNNHKKNNSETINVQSHFERVKKTSTAQKNTTGKKNMMKDLHSIEFSNKKSLHGRRKSEEFMKKTPSQREGRESKQNRRRKDEIVERLEF